MSTVQWIVSAAMVAACVPLMIFWGMWLAFVLLSFLPARGAGKRSASGSAAGTRPLAIDVLIPAHDEEILLPRLLETLRLQTARASMGRVLVVADHCTDRTAALAKEGHAEVLERSTGPRGKPAALRDGLALLNGLSGGEPPAEPGADAQKGTGEGAVRRGVLVLDADCTVSPNLVEHMVRAMEGGALVMQAAYILDEGRATQSLHAAAQIAFALKNAIRPRGMARAGIPTQLFGTGMCFRADILDRVHFADHLTEDVAISHELLLAGIEPVFLPGALVRSPLPEGRAAMTTQKLRWETGQVQTWTKLPVMLLKLMRAGRLRAAVSLLDWSAPPVAMGVLFLAGVAFADVLFIALHLASAWTMWAPIFAMGCLAAYVVLGAYQFSGLGAVGKLITAVPRFLFWKIALYGQMLAGRGPRTWQRTPRAADVAEK